MQTIPLASGATVRLPAGRYWFGCAGSFLTRASMQALGPQHGTGIDQMIGHDGEIVGALFKSPWLPCDMDVERVGGETVRISDESFAVALVPVSGRGVLPEHHHAADIAARGCMIESDRPIDVFREGVSVQIFTDGGAPLMKTRLVEVDWS